MEEKVNKLIEYMRISEFNKIQKDDTIEAYGKKYKVEHKTPTTVTAKDSKGKRKTFYIYEINRTTAAVS